MTTTGRAYEEGELDPRLLEHRVALTGHCYRMLGSAFDAEDAVQETLVRAHRGLDGFEGRSSLQSWLYTIATNVCLGMLEGRKRRALPMDLAWWAPSPPVESSLARGAMPAHSWVEPVLDARVLRETGDPAELVLERDSVRLAFVAALQVLAPRQRAALLLRDVLRWSTAEVAGLLGTTIAAVNSMMQRARGTVGAHLPETRWRADTVTEVHRELLARYVDAFERDDMDALAGLIHEDATQDMPPYAMWLRGRDDIVAWMLGPGQGSRGSRTVPLEVNATLGFAHYTAGEHGHEPWAIQVLDMRDGRVGAIHSFLDVRLFGLFGLPERLEPRQPAESG